jgi:hypothetical protein
MQRSVGGSQETTHPNVLALEPSAAVTRHPCTQSLTRLGTVVGDGNVNQCGLGYSGWCAYWSCYSQGRSTQPGGSWNAPGLQHLAAMEQYGPGMSDWELQKDNAVLAALKAICKLNPNTYLLRTAPGDVAEVTMRLWQQAEIGNERIACATMGSQHPRQGSWCRHWRC